MKTAQDIYAEYNIMPSLQLHQLRVAAAAKLICDNLKVPVNTGDVVLACLFHDMGNILKFDLGKTFPEFLEPEGAEYWRQAKAEFLYRYGDNAHKANIAIGREIGLDKRIVELIDSISFSNIANIVANASFEQKISEYADDRVGPYGVLPLKERLAEARARYIESGKTYYTAEGFDKLSRLVYELERQIFAHTSVRPEDLNDAAVESIIEQLRTYTVA
ncbi:HD domain-containing protein [Candidatus Kaiserbacteria bacterium]|nr:HD domain-containing protein [Candidatus Kaiserbacteria bacterium]